jgi:hypothetical protein
MKMNRAMGEQAWGGKADSARGRIPISTDLFCFTGHQAAALALQLLAWEVKPVWVAPLLAQTCSPTAQALQQVLALVSVLVSVPAPLHVLQHPPLVGRSFPI